MSVPAAILTSVLALTITHEGKSYVAFEVTSSRDRQGNQYRYLQLNSSFKKEKDDKDKTPRITTLQSVQVMIVLGKAAELLKGHVPDDAGQFFFPAKDGSSVSHIRINLDSPVRGPSQGNNDALMARLEAMEKTSQLQAKKADLREGLKSLLGEFQAGLCTKEEYLSAKVECDAAIKALDTPTTVTAATPNTAQPTTGEPECPFE